MASTVLTDVADGVWVPEFERSGDGAWSVTKETLRGGLSDGIDVVALDGGSLKVWVLPTRGMGVWKAEYRGTPVGWQSPVRQPVHPAFVDEGRRNGLGWLDGFTELVARCGLAWHGPPCEDGGFPLTLHGRIANTPAHRLEVDVDEEDGRLSVRGVVDETTLFGPALRLESTLAVDVGGNAFSIADRVTNLSDQPADVELLYHTNVGPPFLGKGARFVAPVKEVAPRDARAAEGIAEWQTYLGPTVGYAEQAYFLRLAEDGGGTRVLLRDAAGGLGIGLDFDASQLPWFTLWKNTAGARDGYVTGLEPCTSLPNPRPFEREQGRVVTLASGETRECRLRLAVHDSAEAVAEAERAIAALAGGQEPVVHAEPLPAWSPG